MWSHGTHIVQCHSDNNLSQITHSKNVDCCLGTDQSSWHYPCLSPLSVLGGGVRLRRSGPGLHIPGRCQVSKIGRPPETQHWSLQFLPPSPPSAPDSLTPPIPVLLFRYTAAVTLHCHNHNLFPAVGLIGTCILRAGGAGLWSQLIVLFWSLCRCPNIWLCQILIHILKCFALQREREVCCRSGS